MCEYVYLWSYPCGRSPSCQSKRLPQVFSLPGSHQQSRPQSRKDSTSVFKIGVSVTRAVSYPFGTPYTLEAATTLLTRKLEGIQASTMNVSGADRWTKQILAYLSWDDQSTAIVDQAWATADAATKADTILLVITTNGDDEKKARGAGGPKAAQKKGVGYLFID